MNLKNRPQDYVQVNFCQKHKFLQQLTQNMTKDCSLNYEFNTWKLQAKNMLCSQIIFCFCIDNSDQFMYITCSNMFWAGSFYVLNSMNNLLSYFGLVNVRINASEKDLPLHSSIWELKKKERKKLTARAVNFFCNLHTTTKAHSFLKHCFERSWLVTILGYF